MRRLEVRTIRRSVNIRGYIGTENQRVQQFGFRVLGFFIPLDEEVVPSHVDISLGAFGDIGVNWQSKFANWIPRVRGGHAEDFD